MNKTIQFLFFLLLPLLFCISSIAAQGQYLTTAELTKILSNRTFAMTDLEAGQRISHVYFAADGRYTILFPSGRNRTTEKWSLDENNNLCLRRARRSGGSTTYLTRCGKVTLDGPNALNLYNDKGELTKKLQFLGNGDLLEQFGK